MTVPGTPRPSGSPGIFLSVADPSADANVGLLARELRRLRRAQQSPSGGAGLGSAPSVHRWSLT